MPKLNQRIVRATAAVGKAKDKLKARKKQQKLQDSLKRCADRKIRICAQAQTQSKLGPTEDATARARRLVLQDAMQAVKTASSIYRGTKCKKAMRKARNDKNKKKLLLLATAMARKTWQGASVGASGKGKNDVVGGVGRRSLGLFLGDFFSEFEVEVNLKLYPQFDSGCGNLRIGDGGNGGG